MTPELIAKAKQLDELVTVNYDPISFQYKVDINMVFLKEKNSYFKQALFGQGFNIESASEDYLKKARKGTMVHVITDKTLEIT